MGRYSHKVTGRVSTVVEAEIKEVTKWATHISGTYGHEVKRWATHVSST